MLFHAAWRLAVAGRLCELTAPMGVRPGMLFTVPAAEVKVLPAVSAMAQIALAAMDGHGLDARPHHDHDAAATPAAAG